MTTTQLPDGLSTLADLCERTRQARTDLEGLERDRDKMIVNLLEKGHSTREIAGAAKLTQARVVQINTKARKARNTANHPVVDGGETA